MRIVLEIGCFVGFSGLGWSHAVGDDGHITTLEFSPEYAKVAMDTFKKNGVKNVEVIIGDAKDSYGSKIFVLLSGLSALIHSLWFRLKSLASTIKEPFDLIFIDADKQSYPTYLSLILSLSSVSDDHIRLLRPGGLIMADNVLRRGLIADASDANPWSIKLKQQGERTWAEGDMKALDQFNKMMVQEERIETFLMPMFDGLGLGRLKN